MIVTMARAGRPSNVAARGYIPGMRVLCVARHRFLSEHLCRFFDGIGVATTPCVGTREVTRLVQAHEPDVIICDYDLLATMPLDEWENDSALKGLPVLAVSLTRHPGEAHLMDVNGIAGFLYLPTLEPADAQRLLAGLRRDRHGVTAPQPLSWPGTTSSVAHQR